MNRVGFKRVRDVAVVVVLAGGAAACFRHGASPDRQDVRRLYVQGQAAHVSDQRLARIARPYLTTRFMNIDTAALEKRLNRLAWLFDVSVTRRWPNGVLIRLNEYKPVARWNEQALLAANGDLFRPPQRATAARLPSLAGPRDETGDVLAMYRRLTAVVAPRGWQLVGLRYEARGSWLATLANGLRLRLGKQNVVDRTRRFARFADASPRVRNQIAQAAYVDLRYADGFAVGGERAATDSNTTKEKIG